MGVRFAWAKGYIRIDLKDDGLITRRMDNPILREGMVRLLNGKNSLRSYILTVARVSCATEILWVATGGILGFLLALVTRFLSPTASREKDGSNLAIQSGTGA
jgi:hypothetical protein